MTRKSLQEKRRYVLCDLISEESFKRKEIVTGIWNSCIEFLGELCVSRTSLWVHEYENNEVVVSCNTRSVDTIIVCLSLIKDIRHKKLRIRVKKISGTIKGLKRC